MGWKKQDDGFEFGEVTVVRMTEKAILVRDEDGSTLDQNDEEWIPFSQIHEDSSITRHSGTGDSDTLYVSSWLAEQNRWNG